METVKQNYVVVKGADLKTKKIGKIIFSGHFEKAEAVVSTQSTKDFPKINTVYPIPNTTDMIFFSKQDSVEKISSKRKKK